MHNTSNHELVGAAVLKLLVHQTLYTIQNDGQGRGEAQDMGNHGGLPGTQRTPGPLGMGKSVLHGWYGIYIMPTGLRCGAAMVGLAGAHKLAGLLRLQGGKRNVCTAHTTIVGKLALATKQIAEPCAQCASMSHISQEVCVCSHCPYLPVFLLLVYLMQRGHGGRWHIVTCSPSGICSSVCCVWCATQTICGNTIPTDVCARAKRN